MYHLRILTGSNNMYLDILTQLKSKIVLQDYLVLTKDNFDNVMSKLVYKPFFSKHYVVEVYVKGMNKMQLNTIIKQYEKDYVMFVYICGTVEDFDRINDTKGEYRNFNGYNPHESVFVPYIQSRCTVNLTSFMFKEIKNRLRGNYSLLDMYIDEINSKKPETVQDLRKIVPKVNRIGLWKTFFFTLTQQEPKKVHEMFDDYRYAGKFMIEYFKEQLDIILYVYEDFYNGVLNKNTVTQYCIDGKDKLKEMRIRPHQVKDILDIFESKSFEELLIIKQFLSKVSKDRDLNYSLFKVMDVLFNSRTKIIV